MISRTLKRFYKPIVVERGILLEKRYALPIFFFRLFTQGSPEIRAGPRLKKNFSRPFGPHFGLKIRGGEPGPPGPSPRSATARFLYPHLFPPGNKVILIFNWTKTLYQNNLKNIAFFFTFFGA